MDSKLKKVNSLTSPIDGDELAIVKKTEKGCKDKYAVGSIINEFDPTFVEWESFDTLEKAEDYFEIEVEKCGIKEDIENFKES